jgi:hypothetical protein
MEQLELQEYKAIRVPLELRGWQEQLVPLVQAD